MTDQSTPPTPSAPGESSSEHDSNSDGTRSTQTRIAVGVGAAVVVILAIVGIVILTAGNGDKPVPTTTTTTSTVASTTSTTEPPPELVTTVMPLTGVPVNGDDPATAAVLARPVLAVKIDNDPAAQPHVGVEQADMTIEVRVEGISRYIVAFHSSVPETVGPVRSARTSDPDLLALFGKPLLAWSGGNDNVIRVIRDTPWIVDVGHSKRSSLYFREKGRRKAPHNLMLRASQLLESSASEGLPPHKIFEYRSDAEPPQGTPSAGFDGAVGSSPVSFRWNPELSKWTRLVGGRIQETASGDPVAVSNVVVLQTAYVHSAADRRSPEAVSTGAGRAWVFSGGNVIEGFWSRPLREDNWTLADTSGAPIKLAAGSTWIALPDDPPAILPTAQG